MCSICLLSDHYELNARTQQECNVTTLACGHKFHLTCLLNCLATGERRCPICRCTYFTSDTDEKWVREQRLKSLTELIRYGAYAFFFYRLLALYGCTELTLAQLFAFYAPPSSSNNATMSQHVAMISGGGSNTHGFLGLLWMLAVDMACLQIQGVMYKIYLVGIVVMRVVHFFVPIASTYAS